MNILRQLLAWRKFNPMPNPKNLISIKQIRAAELSGAVAQYSSGALNATGQLLQSQITVVQAITGQLSGFSNTVNTTGNQGISGDKTFYETAKFDVAPRFAGAGGSGSAIFGSGTLQTEVRGQAPSGTIVYLPATPGTLSTQTGVETLTNKNVVDGAPYDLGNVTGNIALNFGTSKFQKVTLSGSSLPRSITPVPTSGVEGSFLTLRVFSEGVTYSRTLTMDTGIITPSDSAISFPKTLTAGKSYMVKMYYNGSSWELMAFLGGF